MGRGWDWDNWRTLQEDYWLRNQHEAGDEESRSFRLATVYPKPRPLDETILTVVKS